MNKDTLPTGTALSEMYGKYCVLSGTEITTGKDILPKTDMQTVSWKRGLPDLHTWGPRRAVGLHLELLHSILPGSITWL